MGFFQQGTKKLPTTAEERSRQLGTDAAKTALDRLNLQRQVQDVTSTTSSSSTKTRTSGYEDPTLLKGLEGLLKLASSPLETSENEQLVADILKGDLQGLAGLTTQEGYVDAIGRPVTRAYSDALNKKAHLSSLAGYGGISPGAMTRADQILAQTLGDQFFQNRIAISQAIGGTGSNLANLEDRLLNRPVDQFTQVAAGAATAPFTRKETDKTRSTSTTNTLSNILTATRDRSLSERLSDTIRDTDATRKGTRTVQTPSKAKSTFDLLSGVGGLAKIFF